MFTDDWEPRIGKEAAQTLKSASQYIRYFFFLWPFALASVLAPVVDPSLPMWFGMVIGVTVVALLSVAVWAFGTFSIRRKRAGRLAWEYLGRPPQCGQRRILRFALRDPEVFDNYLAEKGITPKGNYASLASPQAIAKGKRNHPGSANPGGTRP